ncbi:MAG: hypothetical protein OXC80_13380, partial [Gammaproteobacteria bacterium]|nr:hypothetical protein [Gammaproteobacteria bacterium]
TNLRGATIFLSASFPSGDRGKRFPTFDSYRILRSVTAFTRAVLNSNGKLVFGGHPTITPIVLMISRDLGVKNSIIVYQSEWFRKELIDDVEEIKSEERGCVIWTPKGRDREDSLNIMRKEMVQNTALSGAVFLGGMEGICEEFRLLKRYSPTTPCIPVPASGGAAAEIEGDYEALGLIDFCKSRSFSYQASCFVKALEKCSNAMS